MQLHLISCRRLLTDFARPPLEDSHRDRHCLKSTKEGRYNFEENIPVSKKALPKKSSSAFELSVLNFAQNSLFREGGSPPFWQVSSLLAALRTVHDTLTVLVG